MRIQPDTPPRVQLYLSGVRAVFHRPDPQKETDKGALKSVIWQVTENA
jgi:hypothetical protein